MNAILIKNHISETGVIFMSWEQVYEQWVHEENLEENLKKQLNDLGEDPEKLEDAFYAPL